MPWDQSEQAAERLPWLSLTVAEFNPRRVEWTETKVSRFWDYLARHDAGEFFSERSAPAIASRVQRLRPHTFLDIGCGTGALVEEMSHRGVSCIGIDSSPDALEAARRRTPAAAFYEGSVTRIPLPEGSRYLGFIFARNKTPAGVESALREAHRQLIIDITPAEEASPAGRTPEPDKHGGC